MHAISSYRGNRPTNTHTHRQDRLQYTTPLSLARRYKVQYRSGNSLLPCIGPQQNSPYAGPHNATEQAPDVHYGAAAADHPAPGGQYSSQTAASLLATRTRRTYFIHFNQTGDKSRADARSQSQPLLPNQPSTFSLLHTHIPARPDDGTVDCSTTNSVHFAFTKKTRTKKAVSTCREPDG